MMEVVAGEPLIGPLAREGRTGADGSEQGEDSDERSAEDFP
jgi:hypothetical protein